MDSSCGRQLDASAALATPVFRPGAAVPVPVFYALSGRSVASIYLTATEYLQLQQGLASEAVILDVCTQEVLGKVKKTVADLLDLQQGGIRLHPCRDGIAVIAKKKEIKTIDLNLGTRQPRKKGRTVIDLPDRTDREQKLPNWTLISAYWEAISSSAPSDKVFWSLSIGLKREQPDPPFVVSVEIFSYHECTGDRHTYAVKTQSREGCWNLITFGPFDFRAYKRCFYSPAGFSLRIQIAEL